MFPLQQVQAALKEFGFDAWLMYDFRGSNLLAQRVLQIPDHAVGSRRCLYCIPAEGDPMKLVHRIESGALDHLPGEKHVYLKWQEFEAGVARLLDGQRQVAMEYSERNTNPYISRVDAGTVELVRSLGVEVASSGDLIQLFEATWDEEQWELHQQAQQQTNAAFGRAWKLIADAIRERGEISELEVQSLIMEHFHEHGMETYHPPIVGVGPHSGDPHYETGTGDNAVIRNGDFVLIDLWAKISHPRGVYSDLTRTGFVGTEVPETFDRIFQIVANARDAAIHLVRDAFANGRLLQGWEIDDACRAVIDEAGYGEAFVHRTGHSIGQETHGNGANIDNLETHETRLILPRTCFSIEPGIYLEEFGVRSEVNVYIAADGTVHVTGGELQREVVPILRDY